MIQHLLREIGGIGIYGVVSVCLFFIIFGATLIWAFQLKKPFLKTMGSLPLDDDLETCATQKGETRHE